eukprot:2545705-Lingulodinium_polyedra.AAC.1
MMRLNRRPATATARELHARALHAHTSLSGACTECGTRLNCLGSAWVGTAWVLLRCCFGNAEPT